MVEPGRPPGSSAPSPVEARSPTQAPTTSGEPASAQGAATVVAGVREGPGTTIGPYKLLQLLGEGGFGSVFLAEQDKPVARRVALKIIKLGMDTRQVIARFEAERQALAIMDHPCIARVLDAGATESGRPFFVMELVRGEPIVEYCDKHMLRIEERLELFAQVCQAVQHAHTKGIIHRDLKPSNILVSEQDGRPSAKIIDFGIAKATASRLTEKTLFTEYRQLIGTPEYMSPEQAEGSLDIDTRTDVYSLGVLLYELLTGTTPFDAGGLRSAAYAEMQRIIREVEPPRPSTRLSRSSEVLAQVAARRHTEPGRLGAIVRGELDWIAMKALEKDRLRRYESANALGEDVRRYLTGEAVMAAPPSRVYRARKFVRRHRAGVSGAGLVALALVLGLAGTAYGLRREARAKVLAQQETARAVKAETEAEARAEELRTVAEFQADMLKQVDPVRAGQELTADVLSKFGAALDSEKPPASEAERAAMVEAFKAQWERVNATDTARELIDRTIMSPAIKAIDEQFQDQPVVDASLRQTLGARYLDLGLYDRAMPLLASAMATRRRMLGAEHQDTLNSVEHMGLLLLNMGKPAEAEPYYREVYEARLRMLGEDDQRTLGSKNNLGDLYRVLGRFAEAEPLLRSALEGQRRVLGNEDVRTMASMNTLGQVYIRQGKKAEAEVLWREAYETSRRVLGEDDRNVLIFTHNLAMVNMELGRLEDAEVLRRELLAKARRLWGEEHPDTLSVMNSMGMLLQEQGKTAEAEAFFREAMEKRRRVQGPDHPFTLHSMGRLGALLKLEGRLSEAELYLRAAADGRRRVLPPGHSDTQNSMIDLAELLEALDKPEDSEPLWRDVLEMRVAAQPGDMPVGFRIAGVRSRLGGAVLAQGRYAEAEPLLIEGYDGVAAASDTPRTPRDYLREACQRVVTLYESWDQAEPGKGHDLRAAEWRAKLEAIQPPAPESP